MKHEPNIAKPAAGMSDEEFEARMAMIPPAPGLPSTDAEIAAALARAEADIVAGRVYPHAVVAQWLLTWGQPGRKPFKEWLADQNG